MQNNQAIPFNKENFKQVFSVKFLLVIAISVPSAILANYFSLPLAWFLGPMLATSIGALVGLKIIIPRIILSSILVLLGLYIGNKILPKLKFSKNKKVISLISTINLKKLKKFTKVKDLVRATPLPPIEIKRGPIIICPPSKFAKNIFKHLGKVLEIRDEKLSYKFWSTASLMAAYYEILNTSSKWLIKKGINKKFADIYVAELFLALSQDALNKSFQGYKKLVADSQTPKGLNMQVLNELKKGKFFTKFSKALDNVNKRVSK